MATTLSVAGCPTSTCSARGWVVIPSGVTPVSGTAGNVTFTNDVGDNDRLNTTNTFGGNKPNTPDNAFNGLGLLNTGLAFAPDGRRLFLANVNGSVKVFAVSPEGVVTGVGSWPLPAATPQDIVMRVHAAGGQRHQQDRDNNGEQAGDQSVALRHG